MNHELAEHISRLAAPIYAVFLAHALTTRSENIPAETLNAFRAHALTQALALWRDALERQPDE